MFDVTALGELLIDFTPLLDSNSGNKIFQQNPGGAPANVLISVTRLGGKGAFIGKVGNDSFGSFLKDTLSKNGVDISALRFSKTANTTIAFVHLNDQGNRSFSFYRKFGADLMLELDEVDFPLIDNSKIFHFGSLSMTDEPAKSATIAAVKYAKEKGKIISYDPNYRPLLWKSQKEAKDTMKYGLTFSDIVKVSENELELLTGEKNLESGCQLLLGMGAKIVLVTLGPKGCYFKCSKGFGYQKTYDTKIVDTTGAGDAFMGSFLYMFSVSGKALEEIELDELNEFVDFSNAAGALCASQKGSIPAMPLRDEIIACQANVPKL